MRVSGILLILTALPSLANAEFYSGNFLVEQMREWERANRRESGTDYSKAARFSAFVAGVHDAWDKTLFCTPSGTNVGQTSAVVAKYLAENPQSWNEAAAPLVMKALAQAFPCKPKL